MPGSYWRDLSFVLFSKLTIIVSSSWRKPDLHAVNINGARVLPLCVPWPVTHAMSMDICANTELFNGLCAACPRG